MTAESIKGNRVAEIIAECLRECWGLHAEWNVVGRNNFAGQGERYAAANPAA